ncbi:EtfA13: electron transfer flavoprotein, subunit alpha [Desulfosarcina variabilis str. Montpellier]|uniref:electron transfer flavoprotein subunit alpha/FixB family protein n=1 Tax=Desulfosarcina variabilis TaxID=2300 RepID=UPI003AFAFC9F
MPQGVLAFTEQVDGEFKKISFEAVSTAKQIAEKIGGPAMAAVMGSGVGAIADQTAAYGAQRILVADNDALQDGLVDAFVQAAAQLVEKADPAAVVIGASAMGKDIAARLSARLSAPLAMDCVDVRVDGDQIVATRPMYGGKVLADVSLAGTPAIVAIRPRSMDTVADPGAGEVETVDIELTATALSLVDKQMETGKIELTEADVVVTGGRGMGSDDFSVVEALAKALDGAVGASRSAVDEGWRPVSDQVGQTGKVVTPNLYVACGVSGAIQHLAGMASSRVVVAINKDPEAPIFSKCDFGIVADLFDAVPAMTAEVEKLKG